MNDKIEKYRKRINECCKAQVAKTHAHLSEKDFAAKASCCIRSIRILRRNVRLGQLAAFQTCPNCPPVPLVTARKAATIHPLPVQKP